MRRNIACSVLALLKQGFERAVAEAEALVE